jgi:hypothetical protein
MRELINQTSKENIQQLFKSLEKLNEPKIQGKLFNLYNFLKIINLILF